MSDTEYFKWIEPDKKVSDLSDQEVLRVYFFKMISPYLTMLTRYFPFSLLWRERRFHYRFKDIVQRDDRIIQLASEKGFWFKFLSFERESRYTFIRGQFIRQKKGADEKELLAYVEKAFAREHVFVSKQNARTVKFSFFESESNL